LFYIFNYDFQSYLKLQTNLSNNLLLTNPLKNNICFKTNFTQKLRFALNISKLVMIFMPDLHTFAGKSDFEGSQNIFRGQNILLYLPTIIENKKSIIFKERKHTIIKKINYI
jgi:hypothetical protein